MKNSPNFNSKKEWDEWLAKLLADAEERARIWHETPHYRIRRGKVVRVPDEWKGKVPHPQTIKKRPSKNLHKFRKFMKHGHENS